MVLIRFRGGRPADGRGAGAVGWEGGQDGGVSAVRSPRSAAPVTLPRHLVVLAVGLAMVAGGGRLVWFGVHDVTLVRWECFTGTCATNDLAGVWTVVVAVRLLRRTAVLSVLGERTGTWARVSDYEKKDGVRCRATVHFDDVDGVRRSVRTEVPRDAFRRPPRAYDDPAAPQDPGRLRIGVSSTALTAAGRRGGTEHAGAGAVETTGAAQAGSAAPGVAAPGQGTERDAVVGAAREQATDDEHDPEGSTIAYERGLLDVLARSLRNTVADVDTALARLARLARGEHQVCERCGGTIAADRMRARPAARTCRDCAGR